MTILSVIRQVCPVVGLSVPEAVFSRTERHWQEMQALANEMAQRIAFDTRDWTALKRIGTFTGDGASEAFNLPADYRRMLKSARLWPLSSPYAPLMHYPDTDQWLGLTVQNFQNLVGAWTMVGRQVMIRPAVADAAQVQFYYLTRNIVLDENGGERIEFEADSDRFALDERLLKLGMIWQWKANKGQAYAEDMVNYEDALASLSGADKGSNILMVGRARLPVDAVYAYPGTITP